MKYLSREIEMIAHFVKNGTPKPLRWKMTVEDEEELVVAVDKILQRDIEKLAGNKMIVYRCQSMIRNTMMTYELKYEVDTCKWYILKM